MKIAYIDTETTGLDPKKHGMVQLACLIVEDYKIIDKIDILMDPFSYKENCVCDDKAFEINGRTIEEIEHFPNSDYQLEKFESFLDYHTVEDKLQIAGYNVEFDIGFIKDWFACSDVKFGDYFNYKTLDVLSLVRHVEYFGVFEFDSHKLADVCKHLEISLIAHNALNDIKATFLVHEQIIKLLGFRRTECSASIEKLNPKDEISQLTYNIIRLNKEIDVIKSAETALSYDVKSAMIDDKKQILKALQHQFGMIYMRSVAQL